MFTYQPDAVVRPSLQLMERDRHRPKRGAALALGPQIKEVLLRLQGVEVIDVHDIGKGNVYLVSTVVDGISVSPVTVELKTFEGIRDGESLPIAEPGVALYRAAGTVPPIIDWRLLVVECDAGIRETGQLMETLSKDSDWQTITAGIKTLVSGANPVVGAALGLVDALFGVIGRILKLNKDDQIGLLAVTYTNTFDDLGVGTHKAKAGDALIKWEIKAA